MAEMPFLPKGIIPDASPQAALLLGTPVGSALYSAAQQAAEGYYNLRPVGSDTPGSLRDRIAILFVQQFADKWHGPISFEAVGASGDFNQIVAFVSPISSRKSFAETKDYLKWTQYKKWLLIGGGVAAAGLVLYYFTRGKPKLGRGRKSSRRRRR